MARYNLQPVAFDGFLDTMRFRDHVLNHREASELLKLENELDDLLLPYKIDLSMLHQIDDPELLDHIRRVGVVFYEKEGNSVRHGDRRPES